MDPPVKAVVTADQLSVGEAEKRAGKRACGVVVDDPQFISQ